MVLWLVLHDVLCDFVGGQENRIGVDVHGHKIETREQARRHHPPNPSQTPRESAKQTERQVEDPLIL